MNRTARAASALFVLLVATGCSSPEPLWVTTSTAIPIVGSLAESISSAQLSVSQGSSASFTITLTPTGGFSGLVQFAPIGSQSGVTFLPASVTISGTEPVSMPMTVSASIDATPGTNTVTLAAAAGNQAAQVAFTLSVLAVQPSPLVGLATSGDGWTASTLSVNATCAAWFPAAAARVTVLVPGVASMLARTVIGTLTGSVPLMVTLAGRKVTPLCEPMGANCTRPLKPPVGVSVMVKLAELPWETLSCALEIDSASDPTMGMAVLVVTQSGSGEEQPVATRRTSRASRPGRCGSCGPDYTGVRRQVITRAPGHVSAAAASRPYLEVEWTPSPSRLTSPRRCCARAPGTARPSGRWSSATRKRGERGGAGDCVRRVVEPRHRAGGVRRGVEQAAAAARAEEFGPWLLQITRRRALGSLRGQALRLSRDDAWRSLEPLAAADAETLAREHETQQELLAVLESLPDDARELLVLFYREGPATRQLASLLELSEVAVRKRLQRARGRCARRPRSSACWRWPRRRRSCSSRRCSAGSRCKRLPRPLALG